MDNMSVEAEKAEMKEDFLLKKMYLVENGGENVGKMCDLESNALKKFVTRQMNVGSSHGPCSTLLSFTRPI